MSATLERPPVETAVLHVGRLHYASEQAVLERVLGRRPGVFGVDALACAIPIAVWSPMGKSIFGLLERIGLTLRPEIAAISMSGSSVLVALNAVALKRLALPVTDAGQEGSTS